MPLGSKFSTSEKGDGLLTEKQTDDKLDTLETILSRNKDELEHLCRLDKLTPFEFDTLKRLLYDIKYAISLVDATQKDVDIASKIAYNYMQKYTWLSSHVPPKAVALSAGIPWEPIKNDTLAARTERIEQYVDYAVTTDQIIGLTQVVQLNENQKH